ncbi:hypothetical protein [Arvimicrobium flavum]|uniref:hypothetical protein n=1 Tax=Arvimicrobium flavum TaxID=3393320 RepID=UPI00237B5CDE|nr:hypothetical protein [Mesorhizobium shangrilense]
MPFQNIYQPSQVKVLTVALDEYCQVRGIITVDGREEVAFRLMDLFSKGAGTVEALRAGLEEADRSIRVPAE